MSLKLVVDSLDGLEEPIAKLYAKGDDGKFRLGVDDVPDVTNLTKALKSERELRERAEKAEKALKTQYDGIDAEEARKLFAQFEGSEEAKLIKEGKIDQVVSKKIERQTAEFNKKLKAAEDKSNAAMERVARVNQRILDSAAREAAVKAGIHQYAVDDFVLALRAEGWTLDDKDEPVLLDSDGQPVLGKDGKTRLTVTEAAESKRDARPHWYSSNASGSGARPSYNGSGAKVMKKAAFDALPAKERARLMADGYSLQD